MAYFDLGSSLIKMSEDIRKLHNTYPREFGLLTKEVLPALNWMAEHSGRERTIMQFLKKDRKIGEHDPEKFWNNMSIIQKKLSNLATEKKDDTSTDIEQKFFYGNIEASIRKLKRSVNRASTLNYVDRKDDERNLKSIYTPSKELHRIVRRFYNTNQENVDGLVNSLGLLKPYDEQVAKRYAAEESGKGDVLTNEKILKGISQLKDFASATLQPIDDLATQIKHADKLTKGRKTTKVSGAFGKPVDKLIMLPELLPVYADFITEIMKDKGDIMRGLSDIRDQNKPFTVALSEVNSENRLLFSALYFLDAVNSTAQNSGFFNNMIMEVERKQDKVRRI